MATLTASQFISKCTYTKPEYEPRFFSKAHIIACPRLRLSNSVKSLQVRSSAVKQSARDENSENMHMRQGMNIVFVSAGNAPWSKTNGLGNFLDGLPPTMAAKGHRVMVITPMYDQYGDALDTGVWTEINVGDMYEKVRFLHCYMRGVDRVFVDSRMFVGKVWGIRADKIHGSVSGTDNYESQLGFSLLCLAALEAPRILYFSNQHFSEPYGEDVVFVCDDWHTALLPCYLKSMYEPHGLYANAKVAFCIHDILSQGRFAVDDFALLNLPHSIKPSFEFTDSCDKPVKGKKINWMKAGILECDILLTVSPYYAEELRSVIECGAGLGQFIKSKQPAIKGIVSGMDVNEWNPIMDRFVIYNYEATTVNEEKAKNKNFCQFMMGFPFNQNIPLIAFIGRLEEKNGADILAAAIPDLMDEDIQLVILGTGKKMMELALQAAEAKYPKKVKIVRDFVGPIGPMVRHVIAGADLLVMPSRYEPCSHIQLLAMKYGTLPVVSCTGCLVDTVSNGKTGFYISRLSANHKEIDPADVMRVIKTLKGAIKILGTPLHEEMIQNCMAQDFSWKGPAEEWERVLLSLGVRGFHGEESI